MFDAIKENLKNTKKRDGGLYLRFEPVNTFLVRLLPNLKNPKNSTLGYYFHMFSSHSDGTGINFTCPTTYKERCPACTLRFKLYRNGGEIDKKLSQELTRKTKYLVNAYVINDPLNPQNNGKVKIIRYGTQLAKIINSAIDGDDAEEFGGSIFDLSENGCNFRIKVETSSEKGRDKWPSYVTSKFLNKSKIEGMTDEKMDEIYNSTHDLDSLVTNSDPEKINKLIKEHFLLEPKNPQTNKDDLQMEDTEVLNDNKEKVQNEPSVESPSEIQKKIDDLLEGVG
jgi:hypothetical protein